MKDDDKQKKDMKGNDNASKYNDRDKQPSNLQEGKDKSTKPEQEDIDIELKIHEAQTERD